LDTNALKRFAQEARRQLMSQVGARLEQVLRSDSVEVREKEKVVSKLREQIHEKSKERVIEEAAYTWFNRFCALRFMDVNRYTFTGIVSPAAGRTQPEILFQAKQGVFDEHLNVDKKRVVELVNNVAASTNPQQEAYRLLLKAACSAYYRQLPFLFADIEDYTELLMPEDLLSQNSIRQKVRDVLTEETCQDVEVIGWLYQFYISEKKDEVMARKSAVPSEDIPAVTQLFTPHWIVRYLVENSLGRLWMLNHPESKLTERMEYYIKSSPPEGQSPEHVEGEGQEYIKISSPEEIKICDPACGSGHMLTYAFDLLSAIYEEQGYDAVKIPGLILKHNLFGVEIDERAGQLAAFALMMKAREKDADFFGRGIEPNICVMENISFSEGEIKVYMDKVGRDLFTQDMWFGLQQFEDAKTYGSLIRPQIKNPDFIREKLKAKGIFEDLFLFETNRNVQKALRMAEYLSQRYQVVVTNPPYLSNRNIVDVLRIFLKEYYDDYKSDLFSSFIFRCSTLGKSLAQIGIMSPNVWLYISAYECLRNFLTVDKELQNLIELPLTGFKGATVQICAFNFKNVRNPKGKAGFIRLVNFDGGNKELSSFARKAISNPDCGWFYDTEISKFKIIPGSPISYWISDKTRNIFKTKKIEQISISDGQNKTGNNSMYLRMHWEVSNQSIGINNKWLLYAKGGGFRKWFGNLIDIIDWSEDARNHYRQDNVARIIPEYLWNKKGITWGLITSSKPSFRLLPQNATFDVGGSSIFIKEDFNLDYVLGILNSNLMMELLLLTNPTLNFQVKNIRNLPYFVLSNKQQIIELSKKLQDISKQDWDEYETSIDFSISPLLKSKKNETRIEGAITNLITEWRDRTKSALEFENLINAAINSEFNILKDIDKEVETSEITLFCNPLFIFGNNRKNQELGGLLLNEIIIHFFSYYVGCVFGRYLLDKPGLILANQGNTLQDLLSLVPQPSFMPAKNNVLPILEGRWFSDDIISRFKDFLMISFGDAQFEGNLKYIENAICKDIRNYFLKEFYDDHLRIFKRRPIYWMFSSPNGTFNALIYMHRYTPDTVSIILNNYLRPFIEKLTAYKNHQNQIAVRSDSDQRQKTKAEKEIASVDRMLNELKEYEEEVLFPLAARKIEIDLDDGVLVNYKKFGKALKYVKGLSD